MALSHGSLTTEFLTRNHENPTDSGLTGFGMEKDGLELDFELVAKRLKLRAILERALTTYDEAKECGLNGKEVMTLRVNIRNLRIALEVDDDYDPR